MKDSARYVKIDIVEWFKERVDAAGGGNYQTPR